LRTLDCGPVDVDGHSHRGQLLLGAGKVQNAACSPRLTW